MQPTIFTGVRNDMRIAQEEVFGPVLSVIRFRDEADALREYLQTKSVWINSGAVAGNPFVLR